MEKPSKKSLSFVVEVLLILLMIALFGLIITLHWTIPAVTGHTPSDPEHLYYGYLLVLAVSGIVGELIQWQARGILRNINRGNPFCRNNVVRLRVIGIDCLALALFYLVTIFFIRKLYMAIFVAVCLVAGLLLFVCAALFKQAILYKEENEMTI